MANFHGYLLTAHHYDTANGVQLVFYGRGPQGPFKLIFDQQHIIFFIPQDASFSPPQIDFERKANKLKSFNQQAVDAIYLKKSQDFQKVKEYCQIKGIRTFELDVRATERFLMERFICSEIEFAGDYLEQNHLKVFKNPQIKPSSTTTQLSSLSLDIETGVKGELYSIGLYFEYLGETKGHVLMLADEDKQVSNELTYYDNEKKILTQFLQIIQSWDPDLIIGWHVIGFDLMFLEKKFQQFNLSFNLGRENKVVRLDERKGAGFFADLAGRVVLDGPPVLRGAFYQFKNFKLETVASAVLGTGKDISSDEGKVDEIERRFREDKEALAKYNLLDCSLVTEIFKKLNIFRLLQKRSQISGLLLDRLNISTAAFDFLYLPRLHRMGYVAPNRLEIDREEGSTGGLTITPIAGRHHDVCVFDFKSLYPSIIRTFGIDPLSNLQIGPELIETPSGHKFSQHQHILPDIITKLMQERERAKSNQDQALSQAIKILMNSFYGVMGSTRCRFYHSNLPSAITQTGHYILNEAISFFENEGLEVLYGDTDSVFVKVQHRDPKELVAKINKHFEQHLQSKFNLQSKLECEFEKTYEQIFFSQARSGEGAAKKRYAGLTRGELEFKGMEFVRSDWTELAKSFQLKLYQMFFADEEIEHFIKQYIQELKAGLFDDQLVYTKRLSKAPEEYTKNIPVHVKAALKIDHQGPYRLKQVSYIMSPLGPEPIQNNPTQFDYEHYIEKQIKPIANDILAYQGKSFDSFQQGSQLSLF